ncbi:hypothetical protein CEXT_705701 [Caerostris extrusa]|uniref:Uncharacterized protein n=1 Tax=Caerostris extrusa TaxID=172846 RepID=A0AAV4M213_CAEEX|nr:hypothetical protein CEXT_705701 [Caerostris extrusa]
MNSNTTSMTEEKLPQEKNLLPPFVVNPELRRESETNCRDFVCANMEIEVSLYGLGVLGEFSSGPLSLLVSPFSFTNLRILFQLLFLPHYYKHCFVKPATDFKFPAITFCHNNVMRRSKFCLNHTDFCQTPKHLSDFCHKHPHFCSENNSDLVRMEDDISCGSEEKWPDNMLFQKLTSLQQQRTRNSRSGNPGERSDPVLHKLQNVRLETFYPWDTPELLFYIHSPFDPITLLQGKTLRPGFQYSISVDLVEEHLLEKVLIRQTALTTTHHGKQVTRLDRAPRKCVGSRA